MSTIKTPEEIALLAGGGTLLARVLKEVAQSVRSGVSTAKLDRMAEKLIRASGGEPSFKGYRAFGARTAYPASLCTSINDEVVHGIPSESRVLQEGDIIGLDIGMKYKGLYTDMAVTVGVGKMNKESERLIEVTRQALQIGISAAAPGATTGDIGEAVQAYVEKEGFQVVRDLVGHGVGHEVHEDPQVPNFGKKGMGARLQEGMVLALEPMVTMGSWKVSVDKDEWTWKTRDHFLSAHFEHTIVITKDGARVLTE